MFKMKTYWLTLFVLLMSILAGCASTNTTKSHNPTGTPHSAPTPAQPTQRESTPMNPSSTPLPASSLNEMTEQARQDLARRLSISTEDINIIEARQVVWPDSSLGCPQPDRMYAGVLTSGYLIKLQFDNREFEYHAGKNGAPFYCENPSPPALNNS
jgi:hypothetical protein